MQFEPLCRLMRGLFRVPVAAVSLDGGKDGLIDAAHAGDRDGWPFLSAFLKPLGRLSSITVMDEARLALDLPKIPFAPPFPRPRFAAVAPFGDRGEGKLVLFDSKARAFKPADIRRLGDFAALAEQSWRLSLDLRRVTRQENDFRLLAEASTDTIVRGDLG